MSARLVITLVVCVLTSSGQSQPGSDLKCVAPNVTPIKVSVNSRQNVTGHWISEVGLEHRATMGHGMTSVDVEHTTASCVGDDGAVKILLTFTASPSNAVANVTNNTYGYELFPGVGIYKYHLENVNWTRARQMCAEEGAHLAIINSEMESAMFVTQFKRYNPSNFPWLGIHRIEDEFFTVFGASLNTTGFMRWSSGPSRGTSYCVKLNPTNGALLEAGCKGVQTFICEQELQ